MTIEINMTLERVRKFLETGERTYTGVNEAAIAELEAMLKLFAPVLKSLEKIDAIDLSTLREETNLSKLAAKKCLASELLNLLNS